MYLVFDCLGVVQPSVLSFLVSGTLLFLGIIPLFLSGIVSGLSCIFKISLMLVARLRSS